VRIYFRMLRQRHFLEGCLTSGIGKLCYAMLGLCLDIHNPQNRKAQKAQEEAKPSPNILESQSDRQAATLIGLAALKLE
jgi:hypothetical protein